jgi:DNA polymerase I
MAQKDMLPLRWMIDNGIKSGIEIEGKHYKPIDFSTPLRIWYLDFEAYTTRDYSTGLNPDEPLIMVTVLDTYEMKLYKFYVVNPNWSMEQLVAFRKVVEEHSKEVQKKYSLQMLTKEYDEEYQFLDGLMQLVQDKDPDVITAWNLNRYDLPKWYQRHKLNKKCLYSFESLSSLGGVLLKTKPIRVKGRVMFDMMIAFKQFTDAEMDSYSLAYVTESEELGIEKYAFEGNAGNTWDKYPDIMLKRNTNDVLIMWKLDQKYGLIETYNELRKEFGLLFHEAFVRNRVIDTALLRMTLGKVVLSTINYSEEAPEKLLGAVVIEPKVGKHNWVIELDVSRGYPTHIQGFNIGPETYREKPTDDCYSVSYNWVDSKTKESKHFEAHFDKKVMSILSALIKFFNDKRSYYQVEMQKVIDSKASESDVKRWERRQYNVKKTTNAIYGVMDFPKFRLHRKECTQATAIIGRIVIEELQRFLKSIGYEMLYGDTDSTFVKAKGITGCVDELVQEGQWLQKVCNDHLDQFFKEKYGVTTHAGLGFKAVFSRIKFFARKMYAGKWVWDEKKGFKEGYEFKGIASVRSDASTIEKESMKELIKMDLEDKPKEEIEKYKQSVILDVRERRVSPIQVAYPAQVKKRLWFDKVKQLWRTEYAFLNKRGFVSFAAHARAIIYCNMYLNTDYGTGDKPRRLPVKLPKDVSPDQQTLFKETVSTFPTKWYYRGRTGGIKEDLMIPVKDIVITEDYVIPKFFVDHIDWQRIEKRLANKLNSVTE